MIANDFLESFESFEIPILGVRLPQFNPSIEQKKFANVTEDSSNLSFLRGLCFIGFKKLNLEKKSKMYEDYASRVKYELEIINELGFVDYILLIWDITYFCKQSGIPMGLGRGSAAGSLILYLIGVTKIDPIKYGLYFERFISKIRAKKKTIDGIDYIDGSLAPDVDLDICYYRRPEVLKYIEEKFKGKTSKILTFNTLSSKLLIKEIGKIVGAKSEEEMTTVTSMIPKIHGQVEDIEKAYLGVPEFKEWCDNNRRVYDTALKLKDLIKNKGVHPSGVLISYDYLNDSCPTELSSDKDIVSSYDMSWVSLFTVKLDALGLRGVSVVDDVCKQLGISVEDIDFEDENIYRNLQDLKHPHGLFQIEADLAFRTTQKVKPRNFNEITAILALARPGSMAYIDDYANFSNNGIFAEFDIESDKLKQILNETGGIILFQETLMRIAKEVFNLSLEQAELIRKACGKKNKQDMEKFQSVIYEQGQKLNIPKSAQFYWDALIASADYSFNKCAFEEELVEEEQKGPIMLKNVNIGDKIKAYDVNKNSNHFVEVLDVMRNNRELYEITLEDGRTLKISLEHKLLCEDKVMRPLKEIIEKGYKIITDQNQKIISIKPIGILPTIDLEVNHPDHNFYCNGIISSNSHACSYAALSAITVYLKFTYPTQFYLSLLKMTKHEPDSIGEISKIHKEMAHFDLKLLPPSLTKSKIDFSIEGKDIRFGLSAIKGVSGKTIEKLNNFKREHANKFEVFQAAKEAGLNVGVLAALIQAGTLESFGPKRALMVYEAQIWNILTEKEKAAAMILGPKFDFKLVHIVKEMVKSIKDEKGKPIIKESRFGTIKKHSERYKLIFEQNNISQGFANWWYEKKLMGYVYHTTLRELFINKISTLEHIERVQESRENSKVVFIGYVDENAILGTSRTARKSRYAKYSISDETGAMKVMIFNESLEECKELNSSLPKEGDIVIVKGIRKGDDAVFANTIAVQQNVIYTKLADFKEKEMLD